MNSVAIECPVIRISEEAPRDIIVKEIDALGGEMGKNIDKTYIQSKMLNKSKGPAVHSFKSTGR